jgi:hypothetical protein
MKFIFVLLLGVLGFPFWAIFLGFYPMLYIDTHFHYLSSDISNYENCNCGSWYESKDRSARECSIHTLLYDFKLEQIQRIEPDGTKWIRTEDIHDIPNYLNITIISLAMIGAYTFICFVSMSSFRVKKKSESSYSK